MRFTEESLDSEKAATADALVVQLDGRSYCGNCGNKVNSPEPGTTCEHEGCQTVWSRVFHAFRVNPYKAALELKARFPNLVVAGVAYRKDDGTFEVVEEFNPSFEPATA